MQNVDTGQIFIHVKLSKTAAEMFEFVLFILHQGGNGRDGKVKVNVDLYSTFS